MLLKCDIEAQSYGRLYVSKLRISKFDCCDVWIFPQLTITGSLNKKPKICWKTLMLYCSQLCKCFSQKFEKKTIWNIIWHTLCTNNYSRIFLVLKKYALGLSLLETNQLAWRLHNYRLWFLAIIAGDNIFLRKGTSTKDVQF